MAKFELSLPTILIIAAVVWLLFFGGIATISGWIKPQATTPTGGTPVSPGTGVQCPDTLKTAYDGDVVNSLDASAVSYIAALGRFIPDGNFNQYTAFTSGSSAGGGTAVDLRCGHAYKYYLLPSQDSFNPVPVMDLGTISGPDASKVVPATLFSKLKANGYDNIGKAFVYNTADAVASDYDNLGITLEGTTDNATGTTMGVGSVLDWNIGVQTINTVSQFGASANGVYVAVDADKSDFDVPMLQLDGVTLVDVKASELSGDDQATLSNFEYVFKLPADIQSTPKNLRIYVAAKSGVNPDADIVLRFVAKAPYVANDGFTIKNDIFNSASAAEIITATPQTVTIDVI